MDSLSAHAKGPVMLKVSRTPDGVSFAVRMQPRASKDALAGLHEGALKVRLCAPPVDGAANLTLLKFLAKIIKLNSSRLEIASGRNSKLKRIKAAGLDEAELIRRLGL